MTFWQRFFARPPIRAWLVGLVPGLAVLLIVLVISDNAAVRLVGAVFAGAVMHSVAAVVWPRLADHRT